MRILALALFLLSGCATQAALNPMIDGVHDYPWVWMSYEDWSLVWLPGDTVKDLNKDPKGLFRSTWEFDCPQSRVRNLPADFSGTIYYDYSTHRTEKILIENGEIKEVWFVPCRRGTERAAAAEAIRNIK